MKKTVKDAPIASPGSGALGLTAIVSGAVFILLCGGAGAGMGGALTRPYGFAVGAAAGVLAGAACWALARKLREFAPGAIIGGAAGLLIGLAASLLLLGVVGEAVPPPARPPAAAFAGLLLAWLGVSLGAATGSRFALPPLARERREAPGERREHPKILDTSVIIDGRIADICEAGFVEGPLVLPQFVLKELQQIADSSDSLKRNRGRRGLDVLRRIRENEEVGIRVMETDFPRVKEVDAKLVLLGKELCGAVMTNDFNLNKVAELQGVRVLNVNELANAVRPVVLPGEDMSVLVVKEGKEPGQGVGYLDDGTMVVVDHARERIGEQVPVSVTSVLQTTAGRMIFTKIRDEAELVRNGG